MPAIEEQTMPHDQEKKDTRALAEAEDLAYADALRRVRAGREAEPDLRAAATDLLLSMQNGQKTPLDRADALTIVDARAAALMSDYGADFPLLSDALAWLADEGNLILCEMCGWTRWMVCPECGGCGCPTRCTGYRHAEAQQWLDAETDRDCCPECGETYGEPSYRCACDPIGPMP